MSDNSKKVSQLPIATDLATTDRVVILRDPSGSPSVRTITKDNLTNSLRYANSSVSGVVKVGDYLTVNATGYLNASNPELANNASYLGGYAANQYAFANAGMSISDFGEGFSLTASDKIVTNKLYSTNESQPTQHYRLTLDTNGVVHLPDESIINGAYIRTVPGSYAGLAAGPDSEHNEDSWMWVDSYGAWIATDYSNNAYTWLFNNDGVLTLPTVIAGDTSIGTAFNTNPPGHTLTLKHNGGVGGGSGGELKFDYGTAEIKVVKDVGTTRTWTFGSDGTLNLPDSVSTGNAIIQTTSAINLQVNCDSQVWTFGTDGNLTLPGDITRPDGININTNNGNITLGSYLGGPGLSSHFHIAFQHSNISEPGSDLFLGDDFNYVKLPGGNGDLYETWGVDIATQFRGTGSQKVWRFGTDGRTTFPTPSTPVHSYGVDGDKAGMIAFDASYIYYCTADYVDDVTDIWKRIAWPGDTW
jgi:hypothetical protein